MEQIHVCIAKMSICDAINDIMKAWFDEANPCGCIKWTLSHLSGCMIGQYNGEWQPKCHKYNETIKIGTA